MVTIRIQSSIQFLDRLDRELKLDGIIGSLFLGISGPVMLGGVPHLDFHFDDAFGSADETYLRFTFLPAFVDVDNSADFVPKIYDLIYPEVSRKNHINIDYVVDMQTTLFPKRTMIKGEVQKVEWYSDQSLTDKVIDVTITYQRNSSGLATSRTTTRKWLNRNESFHEDQKITVKDYTINPFEQVKEGMRRRANIIDAMEMSVKGFLAETQVGKTASEIEMMVRDAMDLFQTEINRFIQVAAIVTDPLDPDFGRKQLAVAIENATEPLWLDDQPTSLGGTQTIREWLLEEVNV